VVVDSRQSVNAACCPWKSRQKSAPDGSTLAIGNNGTHVVNVGLYRKLPYDPVAISSGQPADFGGHRARCVSEDRAQDLQGIHRCGEERTGRFNVGVAGATTGRDRGSQGGRPGSR